MGWSKASEVTAGDIAGVKVIYTPDGMLKTKIGNPSYVKLDARYITDEDTGAGGSPDSGTEDTPAEAEG